MLIISDLEEIINRNRKVKFELDSPGAIRYNGYFCSKILEEKDKKIIADLYHVFELYNSYSLEQLSNLEFD